MEFWNFFTHIIGVFIALFLLYKIVHIKLREFVFTICMITCLGFSSAYHFCLFLNNDKNVVEALNGNLFMLMGNQLITPSIEEGCLNGVMRKQILKLAKQIENVEVVEGVISPFDLQKADQLFITNVIVGIQPITKYRKKEYKTDLSKILLDSLNSLI